MIESLRRRAIELLTEGNREDAAKMQAAASTIENLDARAAYVEDLPNFTPLHGQEDQTIHTSHWQIGLIFIAAACIVSMPLWVLVAAATPNPNIAVFGRYAFISEIIFVVIAALTAALSMIVNGSRRHAA